MEPVQDQGQVVVNTVKNFQGLAVTARKEAQNLLKGVDGVVKQLAVAQEQFAAAFKKIPNCDSTDPCKTINVSHYAGVSLYKEALCAIVQGELCLARIPFQ